MTAEAQPPSTSTDTDQSGEAQRQVLIARGEVSPDDKRLITGLLRRLGLDTEFLTEDLYRARMQQPTVTVTPRERQFEDPFAFSNLTSPKDYVAREHLESFVDIHPGNFSRRWIGNVFNWLVDGRDETWASRTTTLDQHQQRVAAREAMPPAGIRVALREDIGMPPSPLRLNKYGKVGFCALYAVEAGSIVDFVGTLDPEDPTVRSAGVLLVANQLSLQFQEQ